ncbi:MAG: hypothetical protein C5B52_08275, partial [Bacteroidetes bacterium]
NTVNQLQSKDGIIFNMLVENQKPEIRVLKLNNGEEVIAQVKSRSDSGLSVEKPYILVATQKGAQFSPFLLMGDLDASVLIYTRNIIAECRPSKDFLEGYERAISPIVLAPPGMKV